MCASLLFIFLLSYSKMGGFAMGKEEFIHPLDKPLQLLYDSQHKENRFSLRSKELCTLIFNFP